MTLSLLSSAAGGCLLAAALATTAHAADSTTPLRVDLEVATQLALEHSPRLKIADAGTEAADARSSQAAAWINPLFSITADGFGGRGEARKFERAEITYLLEQGVVWSGAGFARGSSARAEWRAMEQVRRLEQARVRAEVVREFHALLIAQARVQASEQAVELAKETERAAAARVAAGEVPPLEERKATVSRTEAESSLLEAGLDRERAAVALSAHWGDDAPGMVAAGEADSLSVLESWVAYESRLDRVPGVLIGVERTNAARKLLLAQRLDRLPPITLAAGVTEYRSDGQKAYVATVALPLPIWNRGSEAITEASALLRSAQLEAETTARESRSGARLRWNEAHARREAIQRFRRESLPASEEARRVAAEGYRAGKFSYLEVLDAQRVWLDTRNSYYAALSAYESAVADLTSLIPSAGLDPREVQE